LFVLEGDLLGEPEKMEIKSFTEKNKSNLTEIFFLRKVRQIH
jgi:hypothetical protein